MITKKIVMTMGLLLALCPLSQAATSHAECPFAVLGSFKGGELFVRVQNSQPVPVRLAIQQERKPLEAIQIEAGGSHVFYKMDCTDYNIVMLGNTTQTPQFTLVRRGYLERGGRLGRFQEPILDTEIRLRSGE